MNIRKYFTKLNVVRAALFVLTVGIIVYFLPHTDSIHLPYQTNRPWIHQLLTAPFDIPVYRDSVSTRVLIDSINDNFMPVYRIKSNAADPLIRSINEMHSIGQSQRREIIAIVNKLYDDGVADIAVSRNIQRYPVMQILDGRTLSLRSSGGIKSLREAYSAIDSIVDDPATRHALQDIQLSTLLRPNISLDSIETSRLYNEKIQPVKAAISVIQQGERIIDRGDIVTPQLATILDTYESLAADRYSMTSRQHILSLIGQMMMASIIIALLLIYIRLNRRDIFDNIRALTAIFTIIVGFYLFAIAATAFSSLGVFLVPFAMIAVLMVVFFDQSTALFIYMLEIILCSCIVTYSLEFVFIESVVGVTTIFSLRELSRRSQLMRTAIVVFATYVVSYLAIELMSTAGINSFSWCVVGYFAVNMVLITFAYILIFVFEKLFGLISSVTLVELSDINTPLLSKLSEVCPGTFQHSMAVSNLASNAAARIGANVQIVRAGALYHDIGKINNPAFFTENQYGVNPHDALSPDQSARVLHNHVLDGLKIADKEKLPHVIRDLIAQHHGCGKAKYFYTKYQNQHPDEAIDDALFIYPGPNPQTREASLLMMADSVEAASRSMTDHSPEAISRLVNNIIDAQVDDGLHRESPLSFRDIQQAKESFISRLRTMYHSRIAYPPAAGKKNPGAKL